MGPKHQLQRDASPLSLSVSLSVCLSGRRVGRKRRLGERERVRGEGRERYYHFTLFSWHTFIKSFSDPQGLTELALKERVMEGDIDGEKGIEREQERAIG